MTNMSITIQPYTEAMCQEVVRFNDRLRQGGVPLNLPTSHVPAWLPKLPGRRLFQEYYLALDESHCVRGGYTLKHEDFWIGGKNLSIADLQLPLSEVTINKAYSLVGIHLLLDALKRQPLLYGLGIGASEEPLARLLNAAGWNMVSVPFFFQIVRPAHFLRNIQYLRTSAPRRWALDLLAWSGLGWLGIKAIQGFNGRKSTCGSVRAEIVEDFSDWINVLWERSKSDYGMSAVRDANALSILYPDCKKRFIFLKVMENNTAIGWAVLLNSHWSDHKQFGNVQLGSIVDCFSAPRHAGSIIRCATNILEEQGVDVIVSNQSHAAWCKALRSAGYLRGPSNFMLATSQMLTKMLTDAGIGVGDIHLNRGDGDGPVNL